MPSTYQTPGEKHTSIKEGSEGGEDADEKLNVLISLGQSRKKKGMLIPGTMMETDAWCRQWLFREYGERLKNPGNELHTTRSGLRWAIIEYK